jgi:hypothetical protein
MRTKPTSLLISLHKLGRRGPSTILRYLLQEERFLYATITFFFFFFFFFSFLFLHAHVKEEEKIQTSNLRFMRHGFQPNNKNYVNQNQPIIFIDKKKKKKPKIKVLAISPKNL